MSNRRRSRRGSSSSSKENQSDAQDDSEQSRDSGHDWDFYEDVQDLISDDDGGNPYAAGIVGGAISLPEPQTDPNADTVAKEDPAQPTSKKRRGKRGGRRRRKKSSGDDEGDAKDSDAEVSAKDETVELKLQPNAEEDTSSSNGEGGENKRRRSRRRRGRRGKSKRAAEESGDASDNSSPNADTENKSAKPSEESTQDKSAKQGQSSKSPKADVDDNDSNDKDSSNSGRGRKRRRRSRGRGRGRGRGADNERGRAFRARIEALKPIAANLKMTHAMEEVSAAVRTLVEFPSRADAQAQVRLTEDIERALGWLEGHLSVSEKFFSLLDLKATPTMRTMNRPCKRCTKPCTRKYPTPRSQNYYYPHLQKQM